MGKRIGRSNRTEGPGHLPRPCVDAAVSEFMTNQNSRSHDLSISLFFLCRNRERDILAAVLSQWQHCSSFLSARATRVRGTWMDGWMESGSRQRMMHGGTRWLDGVGQSAEDDAWRDNTVRFVWLVADGWY
jgi:hypothetical protein